MNRCIMKRSPFIMVLNNRHASVLYEPRAHNELMAGLFDIIAVLRNELLDPQWGQYHRDVINTGEDVSPRVVAEKIARTLQSAASGNPAVLQNSPGSRG